MKEVVYGHEKTTVDSGNFRTVLGAVTISVFYEYFDSSSKLTSECEEKDRQVSVQDGSFFVRICIIAKRLNLGSMEMKFVVLKESGVIIQRFKGSLTYDNWLKSAQAIWEHPDYNKMFRGIIDFRTAQVQMGVAEIKTIVELLKKEEGKALRADTIILIDEPGAAAFASIFAASAADLLNTLIVTTEEGVADKFKLDPSVFEKLESPESVTLVLD